MSILHERSGPRSDSDLFSPKSYSQGPRSQKVCVCVCVCVESVCVCVCGETVWEGVG